MVPLTSDLEGYVRFWSRVAGVGLGCFVVFGVWVLRLLYLIYRK